jgi:hypothetical protein
MKLLTATSITQGQRASDFTWCIEGELVTVCVLICARDEFTGPDCGCGCGRAFSGLNSHKSTTTAIVRDLDFSIGDLEMAVRGYLEDSGRLATADDPEGSVAGECAEIIAVADSYPVGTVLETRMGELAVREVRIA